MRILAIDPGSSLLGWVLYDTDQDGMLDVQHYKFQGDSLVSRLRRVRHYVQHLIKPDMDVDVVAVERMFSTQSHSDFVLHVVSYLVQERADELSILCVEVSTSTAKKAATGRGNARKPEVEAAMRKRFNRAFTPDEADAAAVALAASEMVKV